VEPSELQKMFVDEIRSEKNWEKMNPREETGIGLLYDILQDVDRNHKCDDVTLLVIWGETRGAAQLLFIYSPPRRTKKFIPVDGRSLSAQRSHRSLARCQTLASLRSNQCLHEA